MELVKLFGRNLRALRTARNLTQEDVEGIVGLKRAYISQIENGTRNPTLRLVERIAVAMKVPAHELLREPEEGA